MSKPLHAIVMSILASLLTAATVRAAESVAPLTDGPPSRHVELLEMLKRHRGVLAPTLPDVHPRHTAFNHEAPIPPQCYTKTDGRFNPCYVCHQNQVPGRENAMNDGELQVEYAFSDVGMTNHWQNLFVDRSAAVAAISDEEILRWIEQDNYSALAPRLREAGFGGWIPDLAGLEQGAAAFDDQGFAKDGSHWVAFNYKPFPSTFWPTNGSTDDVMIRLAPAFRTDRDGNYSADVYRANLAIVEATVKGLAGIGALPIDERKLDVDLDGDGKLGIVHTVSKVDSYVGAAATEYLDTYLYPVGTEFLHTVRYVGIGPDGEIVLPRRMKEVRYLKKWQAYRKVVYGRQYQLEGFSKDGGALPHYQLIGDHGLDNGFGWSVQSFIEGVDGELRTATYEENLFCMGCHTSIGATIDKTFSFPRKVDGATGWGYINLRGMPDAPNIGEVKGEIATYLERIGGGGEFRSNAEMAERWFKDDGSVDQEAVARARDVYDLVMPSRRRALDLNKAYRTIVTDQNYLHGRDAFVAPPANVYEFIDNDTAPTLPLDRFHNWDIRLDWQAPSTTSRLSTNP